MCKKKMISLSAAVAVLSTAALAFDTNTEQTVMRSGGGAPGKYVYRDTNNLKTSDINGISHIEKVGPGKLGDALIFPAFYGGKTEKQGSDVSEWSSEFSVVNTSNRAIVAKVVLYGKVASEELRDFNIYLSAHDVFRAKLENGRLISTDGSTVAEAAPSIKNKLFPDDDSYALLEIDENRDYRWNYNAVMASDEKPLDMFIDPDEEIDETTGKTIGDGHGIYDQTEVDFEHDGYIVVYAMAQANAAYHDGDDSHKNLLIDYRHLVDTCRNSVADGKLNEWQHGIQDGIYSRSKLYLPNVSTEANTTMGNIVPALHEDDKPTNYMANRICSTVFNSAQYPGKEVEFRSPDPVLTGSILVSSNGSDGRGTRDMLLKAYAIDNFTDNSKNQMLLWTEGEFAHLADRCLTHDLERHGNDAYKSTRPRYDGNTSVYNRVCVERDANQLALGHTYYEYTATDPDVSRLVVTQPYKRVLVQFKARTDKEIEKAGGEPTFEAYAWNADTGFDVADRRGYGTFSLGMDIYDDDENSFTPTFGNFIVSPANAGTSSGIPFEVSNISIFDSMSGEDKVRFEKDFKKGYAIIAYERNGANYLSGIVTQMSAVIHEDKKAEINWIYPYTEYVSGVETSNYSLNGSLENNQGYDYYIDEPN